MRLLLLTQFFPPEVGAPQLRLADLGERLIDRGWEVEALTALPNFPMGRISADYSPFKCCVEQIGRIRCARVPIYPAKMGFLRRLASYFSFVATASSFGPRLCQRPDVLLVESPPLFIGYAARYLAWRWKCPYVFNVSDLWPESSARMGFSKAKATTRMAERLELSLCRYASAVTGESDEIVSAIRRRVPETPNEVIATGVTTDRFGPHTIDAHVSRLLGEAPGPIFIYIGPLGPEYGLEPFLEVAKRMPADVPGRFVLVGDGPSRESIEQRIRDEQLSRVTLLPPQPRELTPALFAASDVAIFNLGVNRPGAMPSKIYEAMASHLPLLVLAAGAPVRRLQQANCGLIVSPANIDEALQACVRLATDPELRQQLGECGRRAAESEFNRDRIADRLDVFLTRVIHNPPLRATGPAAAGAT